MNAIASGSPDNAGRAIGILQSGELVYAVTDNAEYVHRIENADWVYRVGSPDGRSYDSQRDGRVKALDASSPGPAASAPPTSEARGVRTELSGDLVIERLHFASAQLAVQYAMNGADMSAEPTYIETRGNQAIIIRSDAVRDPSALDALVAAAFGEGLRVPTEPPGTTGLFLGDGNILITTTDSDPIFDEQFKAAQDKHQEKLGEGAPGFSRDGEHRAFELSSGGNGYVEDKDGQKAVVYTTDAKQRALIDRHREHLAQRRNPAPDAQQAKPVQNTGVSDSLTGAADVLGGLFD
jgi:hypothetical protein